MSTQVVPKNQNLYDEEKVSGTRASTKTASRFLVIGGPAEGKMFEGTSYTYRYPEIKPVTFRATVNPDDLLESNTFVHTYRLERLGFKDENERPHFQSVYLHSSLTIEQGMERLKDFLVKQFIMLEM